MAKRKNTALALCRNRAMWRKRAEKAEVEIARVDDALREGRVYEYILKHTTDRAEAIRRAATRLNTDLLKEPQQCEVCHHQMFPVWSRLNEKARPNACPRCLQDRVASLEKRWKEDVELRERIG